MKKKLILSMLTFISILALAGCSSETNVDSSNDNVNVKVEEEVTAGNDAAEETEVKASKPAVTKEGTVVRETVTMPNNPNGSSDPFVLYDTTYDNNGNILSYVSNYPGNEIVRNYEYSADGKLTRETEELIGQGYNNELLFDEDENLVSYNKVRRDNENDHTSYTYSYTYDADGNATECFVNFGNESNLVWERTYENGKLTKSIEQGKAHYPLFDANTYCDNTEVLYNDLGQMYQISWTDDSNMNVVETITYNEQGQMTLIWSELANAEVDSFTYDEEGSQINYLGARSYSYEYDEFGNKIFSQAYAEDGTPGFTTTYEYYYAN